MRDAGTPELKALVSPLGHSVSQRQSRPRGRQTPRAMGRSPRNVCEEMRHWDAGQGGTGTSMQHGLGEHKPHDQHDSIVGQAEDAPKLDR